eukprot:GHVU01225876.1.p1 GENE.GHVU01225876.1~~GHVU01225876.1.p1  ORF type:complete len:428 (-),score=113.23 GHVU01225876.1:1024-2136(-)
MTTASVEEFVKGTLRKLGLKEEAVTRMQTGGPGGDLGCNSLLMSHTRTTSLLDSSGVLHDPEGLNRDELVRIAMLKFEGKKTNIHEFDTKLLSKKGFRVSNADKDVTLPDGTVVSSGFHFRNEFHLNPMAKADLFVPCGGRPESVSPSNVAQLFETDGTPRYKYIVEGANSFVTQDARKCLEQRGVVLFKDASANKGGVTSSSLEVLACLALDDEEFAQHMAVKDPNSPPEFYRKYVTEVQRRVRENAFAEFESLWADGESGETPRCELSDVLSGKIVELRTDIRDADFLYNRPELREAVVRAAVPDMLMPGLIDYDTFMTRLPKEYLKALFATSLASRFYYRYGTKADQFAFFQFVNEVERTGGFPDSN